MSAKAITPEGRFSVAFAVLCDQAGRCAWPGPHVQHNRLPVHRYTGTPVRARQVRLVVGAGHPEYVLGFSASGPTGAFRSHGGHTITVHPDPPGSTRRQRSGSRAIHTAGARPGSSRPARAAARSPLLSRGRRGGGPTYAKAGPGRAPGSKNYKLARHYPVGNQVKKTRRRPPERGRQPERQAEDKCRQATSDPFEPATTYGVPVCRMTCDDDSPSPARWSRGQQPG